MNNLIKHRWFELRHNPILWMTFAICCVLTLLLIGVTGEHYLTDSPMVAGVSHDWLGLFMNSTADCIFPLLMISGAFTSMMLGQQFSSRTIDQEIAAGHSRAELFFSHCMVGFVVPGTTVLLAIVIGCLRWVGSFPMPSAEAAIPYFFRVVVLLPLLGFSLFSACILFVVLFRDTAKTMAVSALFLLIACWTMPALEQSLPKAPGTLYPITPTLPLLLHPAFLMRYVLYSTLTFTQGIEAAGVAVGWAVLFLSVAYCVFRRCELK